MSNGGNAGRWCGEEKKGTVPICRNGLEAGTDAQRWSSHKWGLSPFFPILTLLPLLAAEAAPAADQAEAAEQVWLISTRAAPVAGDLDGGFNRLSYWRLNPAAPCEWLPTDAQAFHTSARPAVPTAIFIHGNRVDADDAIEEAWCLYQRMKQQACGRPFRFVVWSWPADRIVRRNRPDVQIKACYSDAQGYYLARSLREMPPGAPVTLIGHSFGARAILGALHLMAGGQVAGRALPGAAAGPAQHEPPRIRAVLAAAAVDADALLPCHAYGLALSQAERILVTENGRERALKWYPRMYGRRGPEAMGYVGPLCCPRAGCDKLEVVNVACSVGRAHSWYRYQAAPEVVQRLGWYTLFEGSAE